MNLYVFDDHTADGWNPFSLTRPCGELRYGDRLLRERLERFAGQSTTATLSRGWLGQFTGKRNTERLRIRQEVDVISGATMSSSAITRATNKVIALYGTLAGQLRQSTRK